MELNRRTFLKSGVAAATAMAVGIPVSRVASAAAAETEQDWRWDKGVCRFCGVGCGIMIATQDGRIVATKGDPDAPVNRGLNCVKGYFNGKILYGKDRLTQPLMRMTDGRFDKKGKFTPVTWDQAFDEMTTQFKKAYAEKGPTGVGVIGSGQWLIQEGYAMTKLMKAGFRSNNLDPNARNCMASAVAAFMQVFGIDEPPGNYDDIEYTDTIVAWGANMAEAHPVLWQRIIDRRLGHSDTKIVNITTLRNMTSEGSDLEIIIKPNTDTALLNYLAREIIQRGAVNQAFVDAHCVFCAGPTDIGYGMRATDKFAFEAEKDIQAREIEVTLTRDEAIGLGLDPEQVHTIKQDNAATADRHWLVGFEDFKTGVEPYTLDFVAELAKGDSEESLDAFKAKLVALAELYADQNRKMVSFWTMGFNQHVRGTWVNEQIYSVHLLLGKISEPGNSPFSLTGQPSACGTAREVGTFSHRLPADMVVNIAKHRDITEQTWKLPPKTLNPKVGSHITKIMRDLEDGSMSWVWVQVNNPFQHVANANHWLKAARENDNFIVVSDAYPSISAKVADLILPVAMIFEKWGGYGNAERRTQLWREQVPPPGDARSDLWQILEFSKRFTLAEVWKEQAIPGLKDEGFEEGKLPDVMAAAQEMGYRPEMTLYEALFETPENKAFAWPDPVAKGHDNHTVKHLGVDWFVEKALFEEYAAFGRGHHHDLASFDVYYQDDVRGLRWPVVDGKETPWRFNAKYDPYVKNGEIEFYGGAMKELVSGNLNGPTTEEKTKFPGKAKIFFRPYAAPVESPDGNYDLWLCTGRLLEHWHTGTMTRRVPELHRAMPAAVLDMNEKDAEERGLKRQDAVWIESRRGKIKAVIETTGRNRPPRGYSFMAFFDESVFVNKLCIDATCPISKEEDFKKTAIKIYKV
jgi:nitrate reductase (cytochrome)